MNKLIKKFYNLKTNLTWAISRRIYQGVRRDLPSMGISNSEDFLIKEFFSKKNKSAIVFDIGANVGEWSKNVSRINSDAKIYSFEPIKSTFENLKSNLDTFSNISTINLALSSEEGVFEIYNYGENSGTNSFHNIKNNKSNSYKIEKINTTTIDLFTTENNIDNIDFIKCDTEGNDYNVILGCSDMFNKEKIGLMQFEYNWRWLIANSNLQRVFDSFKKSNYFIGKACKNEIQIIESWNQELDKFYEANYIIIHKNYLKFFKHNFYFFNHRNILVLK